jgi:hypothetical protein
MNTSGTMQQPIIDYLKSVHSLADPKTGLLSPGDSMRLLQDNGSCWEDYLDTPGPWPKGSRKPRHILGHLGY